jgi:hypothetical protein
MASIKFSFENFITVAIIVAVMYTVAGVVKSAIAAQSGAA